MPSATYLKSKDLTFGRRSAKSNFIILKINFTFKPQFRPMEPIQHELYEYARDRIKQKKGLFYHFILLFLGCIFLIVANNWLGLYPDKTWWTWAVTVWIFLFILHVIKVFVINNFMNKNWEREQIDKLMLRQANKIEKLKNDLENSNPKAE